MSCYKYWKKISQIAEELNQYHKNQMEERSLEEILPLLDSIEEIAHDQKIDFDNAKHILNNGKMGNDLKTIREFYIGVGLKLETENAVAILDSDDPWDALNSFYFYQRYEKLVQNENRLLEFIPGKRVVFIGGGPLPLTLIMLNKVFGLKGISIEIVPEIAQRSREVVEKLGLKDEIEVVFGDETAISDLKFDFIMVAALAEPKKRIFRNLKNLLTKETKILYRTYTGMRAILYAPVTEEDILGFKKIDMILPTGKVNNTSVLIKKKGIDFSEITFSFERRH
jgi:hypothetical protein